MAQRLLFVCAMNVCRSPLAAGVFSAAIRGDEARRWVIDSAGTSASTGEPMCSVSAENLGATESFVESHASLPIASVKLDSYDAVIVATRAERAMIARIDPAMRPRVFTVKEAVALGRQPVTPSEHFAASSSAKRRLANYASVLHRRRGRVALPSPRPSLRLPWSFRARHDPLDTVDVHLLNDRAHTAGLAELRADVTTLQRQLAAYLDQA